MARFIKCNSTRCGHIWIYGGNANTKISCPRCKMVIDGPARIEAAKATLDEWTDYKARGIVDKASRDMDELMVQVDMFLAEMEEEKRAVLQEVKTWEKVSTKDILKSGL